MFVKDVDLEAMPTSIFLNDDDDDVRNPSLTLTVTFAFELSGYDYKLITGSSAVNGVAALFYSPVDCTDASDMHHSNASLMHR